MRDNDFPEKCVIVKANIKKSKGNQGCFIIKIMSLLFYFKENIGGEV